MIERKRTSFDLTSENSKALEKASKRTGENYSTIINTLINCILADHGEVKDAMLSQGLKEARSLLLSHMGDEKDGLRILKEYVEIAHNFDFFCRLVGYEGISEEESKP